MTDEGKEGIESLEKGTIISRDKKALDIMGYSREELATVIKQLHDQGLNRYEQGEKVENNHYLEWVSPNGKKYHAMLLYHMGHVDCPWSCKEDRNNYNSSLYLFVYDYDWRDRRNKDPVADINGLLIHTIQNHGYFGGAKTTISPKMARVSPEEIVDLFLPERKSGSIEQAKKLQF